MTRARRYLFTNRRQQVLLSMLFHPAKFFTVRELAVLSDASTATTSQTLQELERYN
jgi:Fic family protein